MIAKIYWAQTREGDFFEVGRTTRWLFLKLLLPLYHGESSTHRHLVRCFLDSSHRSSTFSKANFFRNASEVSFSFWSTKPEGGCEGRHFGSILLPELHVGAPFEPVGVCDTVTCSAAISACEKGEEGMRVDTQSWKGVSIPFLILGGIKQCKYVIILR